MSKILKVEVDWYEGLGNDASWVITTDEIKLPSTSDERVIRGNYFWRNTNGAFGNYMTRGGLDGVSQGFGRAPFALNVITEHGLALTRKFLGAWSCRAAIINRVFVDLNEPLVECALYDVRRKGGIASNVIVSRLYEFLNTSNGPFHGVWVYSSNMEAPKFVPIVVKTGFIKNYLWSQVISHDEANKVLQDLRYSL